MLEEARARAVGDHDPARRHEDLQAGT
jgi:hypothetical protein